MNSSRWGLGCVWVALLAGLYFAQARAQGPEGAAGPAATFQSDHAAEKSVLAGPANQSKAEVSPADFWQSIGQGDAAAVARIERALDTPLHSTGLDYADTPLQDVVNQLQEEYGIPIQLDKSALEEAGIGTDAPVTINLHNISLRSALRLMLYRRDLTSIIQNEVLLITTKEAAEKELKICVYDARKIIPDTSDKKMEALSDTIVACVATDSWAENGGGNAEIRTLPPGLLVITQTQAVHQEIRELLATIRRMTQNRPSESKPEPAPKQSSAGTRAKQESRPRKSYRQRR